jgi:epoxide hydrolase-like predicted phosphatase
VTAAEPARALLVDFGGVLTSDVFDSFREFSRREGLEPGAVKRLFREDPEALALLRELERGEIDEEAFAERFAPMLGVADHEGLVDRLFAGMRPDQPMLEAVGRARARGVRTGLISNSWGSGRYDREALPELFDAVVISGEVGLHKPQPEIFRLAAERVGVPADRCVFVDDLKENCAGAEAVGMTAVLHRGADSTLPELERVLGVALA